MKRPILAGTGAILLTFVGFGATAQASEPIVGQWRAPEGGIVGVEPCGSEFCATVLSGEHQGKAVGRMSGAGTQYEGTVTDPREDQSYDGTAVIENGGETLTLEGCALVVFCKVQTWERV